jgi:hypothetical protein
MQIGRGVGALEWAIVVVGALYCAVVAYKSFDYVRDSLRRSRDAPPPSDDDGPGMGPP